jgi:hypothetical protein
VTIFTLDTLLFWDFVFCVWFDLCVVGFLMQMEGVDGTEGVNADK